MSEIILGESTEVAVPEALVEGQSLGVWLDGQREVTVQKAVGDLQNESNPIERAKLFGVLFFLRLGQLTDDQAKVVNDKIVNSMTTHLEKLVRDEHHPQMRELFQTWLELSKYDPRNTFPTPTMINRKLEIEMMKEALKHQSLSLESRHVLYLELFTRLTSSLSPEVKEKLPSDGQIRFFNPGREIVKIHAEMVENAKKLQDQQLNHLLKASLAGKELPKMSFPLLQIFELERRCGVALSRTELLEEGFEYIQGFSQGVYPFISFSVEAGKALLSLSQAIVKLSEEAMSPYTGLIDTSELSQRAVWGKFVLLTLYHQGKLFEGEALKTAMNFYCSSKHSTPEEGVRIIKSLCAAARAIISEDPEVGSKLLPLIKSAYIDQQLYLSWFPSMGWSGCRAQALLELGKLAHELTLPDLEHSLMKEASNLFRNAGYSKESELKKEYGYSYAKKAWFNP